jgi:gamma-glutamylcyclotransferase (GGCT)/AIG2-like uncharacterized protein YtfP
MTIIYTYGTLRPGLGVRVHVPGRLYSLGQFPGMVFNNLPDDPYLVVCEPVEIPDENLSLVDAYEGYYQQNPEGSLYIRRPYLDGFIYEFNQELPLQGFIPSGDWLQFTGQTKGRASGHFG